MAQTYFTFPLKDLKARKLEQTQIAIAVRKGAKNKSMNESKATIVDCFSLSEINTISNSLTVLQKVCNDALTEIISDQIRVGKVSGVAPTLSEVCDYLLAEKTGNARFSKDSILAWFNENGKGVISLSALVKLFGAKDDIDSYSQEEITKAGTIADNFGKLFSRLSTRKDKDSEFSQAEYKQLCGAWKLIKENLTEEESESEIVETLETKISVEFKPAAEVIDALF